MSHILISTVQIKKKQSTNIKCDENNKMNIINDNTFNQHNNFLNNDNRLWVLLKVFMLFIYLWSPTI